MLCFDILRFLCDIFDILNENLMLWTPDPLAA